MTIKTLSSHNNHREFPDENISLTLKIKYFIPQQIIDKSTALSSKQFLSMHAFML